MVMPLTSTARMMLMCMKMRMALMMVVAMVMMSSAPPEARAMDAIRLTRKGVDSCLIYMNLHSIQKANLESLHPGRLPSFACGGQPAYQRISDVTRPYNTKHQNASNHTIKNMTKKNKHPFEPHQEFNPMWWEIF